MVLKFEELRVLRAAEAVADQIWQQVVRWETFARDTVGTQMVRAADSIGANIAEAYGRYHYGEKLQFLYYARGSLFETKYWLNRAQARNLVNEMEASDGAAHLTDLARQLNSYASHLKAQRRGAQPEAKAAHEAGTNYVTDSETPLIGEGDMEWLRISNLQS